MAHISVIIPAFNAETYIRETIESAIAQTCAGLEVIVVDDGSTDATCAIVGEYRSAVRLIPQSQGGAAKARNAGVAAAGGEWIAFLDADDVWTPDKLRVQLDHAGRTGATFLFSDRINIGARGSLPEVQSTIQPLADGDIFEPLLLGNFITTSSVLLRHDVFDLVGRFSEDPSLPPAEDWDLWARVAAGHRASACPAPLVRYRHHLTSASRNVHKMNRARGQVIQRALDLPRGRTLSAGRRREIWSHTWATNGWDCSRHGQSGQALRWYLKSLTTRPVQTQSYVDIIRVCLGRH